MTTVGHNSNAQLRAIVERIERMEEEKKAISSDIADIYKEAKSNGYDAKALREVVRLRKQDKAKRETHEALVDLYRSQLGMLADTPLGQSALERV